MKKIRYYLFCIIIGLILITAGILTNKIKTVESNIAVTLYFSAIYFPLLLIMTKQRFRRSATKVYYDTNNKNLFSQLKVSFSEAGISGKSEFSEFQYQWSGIKKMSSTKNTYILYSSNISGLVIPKRIFKTVEEKESFEKMLAQYLLLQANLPIIG
jgi:hypothetical protein